MRRRAVRHLHAGNDPGVGVPVGTNAASHRSRSSRRAGRQSLPLHGLYEDFRSGPIMRSYVPNYELRTPQNFSEALEMVGEWKPFAGGTDLMVLFEAGKLPHKKYINIRKLPELRGIHVTEAHVTLGALTTYTAVQRHPVLQ